MSIKKDQVILVLTLIALAMFSGSVTAQPDPYWAETSDTQPLPINAEFGGSEKDGTKLPLCWAGHLGGIHPGKVVRKQCNITYGGKEIPVTGQYVVYNGRIKWQTGPGTQLGNVPAITGAYENGQLLPLCQARLMIDGDFKGTYPGKVLGGKCHVGWAGKEYLVDTYQVGFPNTPLRAAWFSNKIYRIVSVKSSKGIKTKDPNRAPGSGLIQSGDTKTTNEHWQMYWEGAGYYRIRSFATNTCLDSTGTTRTTNAALQLRPCVMSDSQMWTIASAGAGQSRITSKDTGRVLHVDLGSMDDGAAIYLWERNNGPFQLWRFETVSTPATLQFQCEESLENQVAWNRAGVSQWNPANRKILCAGTKNPDATIACFVDFIKTKKDDYNQAIQACKAK